jgi:GNAT superfamily N-acetyltransferase
MVAAERKNAGRSMTIRPLRIEDMEQVALLLATRDGYSKDDAVRRTAILHWIAFRNPFRRDGEPTYYVVESGGRIAAIHGRMPVMFSVHGKPAHGYYVHDLYVHKEERDKGQGFWMTMALAKEIERETSSFFSLFGMTPLNVDMQRRRKYRELSFDAFVRFLRPDDILEKYLGSGALMQALRPLASVILQSANTMLVRPKVHGIQVDRVTDFDDRFDELFNRLSPKLGICTAKTSAYLRWKYGDGPCRDDHVLVASRVGRFLGYLIASNAARRKYPTGIIRDIVVDPDDGETVDALMRTALTHFMDGGAFTIRCVTSDPRFARILKRRLFIRLANHEMIFLGNLDKSPIDPSTVADIGQWHMTYGESDIFMFSGGTLPREVQSSRQDLVTENMAENANDS